MVIGRVAKENQILLLYLILAQYFNEVVIMFSPLSLLLQQFIVYRKKI